MPWQICAIEITCVFFTNKYLIWYKHVWITPHSETLLVMDWRSRVLKVWGPRSLGTCAWGDQGLLSQKQLSTRITFARWLIIEPRWSGHEDAAGNPIRQQKGQQLAWHYRGALYLTKHLFFIWFVKIQISAASLLILFDLFYDFY